MNHDARVLGLEGTLTERATYRVGWRGMIVKLK